MAYPLSKKELKGHKILTKFVIFTMYFGGGLIPNYVLMMKLHLVNKVAGFIIPSLLSTYYIILMKSFFAETPHELEEAGELDGLTPIGIFIRIVLPRTGIRRDQMPAQSFVPDAENPADILATRLVGITDGREQGTVDKIHQFIFCHGFFLRTFLKLRLAGQKQYNMKRICLEESRNKDRRSFMTTAFRSHSSPADCRMLY